MTGATEPPVGSADSEPEATAGGPPAAWVSFIRGHAAIIRELDLAMRNAHGLNLNEYEVMLQLWLADEARLRRVDLSERLLITQGGITRLLAGLERAGLVERIPSTEDARVVYAELTTEGTRRLEIARRDHLTDVRRLFSGRFDEEQLTALDELLSRLPQSKADCE